MATSEFLERLSVPPPGSPREAAPSFTRSRVSQGSTALWIAADILTVCLAVIIGFRVGLGLTPLSAGIEVHRGLLFQSRSAWVLLGLLGWFVFSLVLVSRRYHLYEPLRLSSTLHEQRLTVQACLTSGLLLTGTLYLIRGQDMPRSVVLVTVAATTVMLCLRRLTYRALMYRRFDRGLETRNILIIGSGRVGQALRHHLNSVRHLGYTFKGYIHVPGQDKESAAHPETLGPIEEIFELARKHFVDEIFFATPCESGLVKRVVAQARIAGVDVRVVPDLYDGLAWNSPVEYVGRFPTIPLHRGEVPEISLFFKRSLDIVLSSSALLALSPLMAAIALAVKLDSPGPVLYSSERIGKKGRVFRCMKFRTMVRDAERRRVEVQHMNERDNVLFKVANDPRITRVGRLLRKYSLDEIPQFLNVLRGDMSMVGPRPPIASEVKQYHLSHLRRLDVTPGITGLWQVQARQDPSFDSYISLDTAYIENWSIWLDLKILIRTFTVVIAGTGS